MKLKVDQVTMRFGGLTAVDAASLCVENEEIHALIGPNGAGKSTLFSVISGIYTPTSGSVYFEDQNITTLKPHQISKIGISRTFQNILLFESMTVLENIIVGRHNRIKSGIPGAMLGLPSSRREEKACREKAEELIEFIGLSDKMNVPASSLPYGQKRLLEIGRALASDPTLLLLDEPAAGMNTSEMDFLNALIMKVRSAGISVLLVEHNMQVVMQIADNITVLDHGKKIAEGKPEEIQNDPLVIEAYLGKEDETNA